MQDLIGRTLGHYHVVEKIGAGGMGEVYRAKDERLGRDVAVKTILGPVARDEQRMARFEREAKLLASLSHQNIAQLYGLETVERTVGEGFTPSRETFLVMELAAGETLARKIGKGPIPIDDALDYARQIAEGLEAAHKQGIIHRDLKPANIMLSDEGGIKILDFGLAKGFDPSGSSPSTPESIADSPTLTAAVTGTGVLLGTAAYMSPEQARGKAVDKRADVWAFGCVLYEMLTGHKAFQGEDSSQTMAAILRDEPEWAALPPATPNHIRRLLQRCLVKKARDRLHDVADARIVIESEPPEKRSEDQHRFGGGWRSWFRWLTVAAMAVIAVVVGLIVWAPWRVPVQTASDPLVESEWVAVSPLENRTGDLKLDHLGQRIVDLVTQRFSEIGRAAEVLTMEQVPYPPGGSGKPAPSPMPGSSPPITPKGPHMLASGSYYLEGNELVFQVRLADYDTGELLFAFKPLRAPQDNLSPALDELRERVVAAAAAQRDPNIDIRLMNPPASCDALAAHAKAYDAWGYDYEKTVDQFQEVVDIDPEFHVARFFLLMACGVAGDRERYDEHIAEAEERSRQFTSFERARFTYCKINWWTPKTTRDERINIQRQLVDIAPHLKVYRYNLPAQFFYANRPREALSTLAPLLPTFRPDSHPAASSDLIRATVYCHALGEYEQELEWANIGLEKFPDVGDLYVAKARALAALGQVEAVVDVIEACNLIELKSAWRVTAHDAGTVMLMVGLELRVHGHANEGDEVLELAVDWYQRRAASILVEDRDSGEIFNHSSALRATRRWAEAKVLLEELERREYSAVWTDGALGVVAAEIGDIDEAHRRFDELGPNPRYYALVWRACIAAHLGNKDQAVDLIREFFEQGHAYNLEFHHDADLEPLWDYPAYQELIAPKG